MIKGRGTRHACALCLYPSKRKTATSRISYTGLKRKILCLFWQAKRLASSNKRQLTLLNGLLSCCTTQMCLMRATVMYFPQRYERRGGITSPYTVICFWYYQRHIVLQTARRGTSVTFSPRPKLPLFSARRTLSINPPLISLFSLCGPHTSHGPHHNHHQTTTPWRTRNSASHTHDETPSATTSMSSHNQLLSHTNKMIVNTTCRIKNYKSIPLSSW